MLHSNPYRISRSRRTPTHSRHTTTLHRNPDFIAGVRYLADAIEASLATPQESISSDYDYDYDYDYQCRLAAATALQEEHHRLLTQQYLVEQEVVAFEAALNSQDYDVKPEWVDPNSPDFSTSASSSSSESSISTSSSSSSPASPEPHICPTVELLATQAWLDGQADLPPLPLTPPTSILSSPSSSSSSSSDDSSIDSEDTSLCSTCGFPLAPPNSLLGSSISSPGPFISSPPASSPSDSGSYSSSASTSTSSDQSGSTILHDLDAIFPLACDSPSCPCHTAPPGSDYYGSPTDSEDSEMTDATSPVACSTCDESHCSEFSALPSSPEWTSYSPTPSTSSSSSDPPASPLPTTIDLQKIERDIEAEMAQQARIWAELPPPPSAALMMMKKREPGWPKCPYCGQGHDPRESCFE